MVSSFLLWSIQSDFFQIKMIHLVQYLPMDTGCQLPQEAVVKTTEEALALPWVSRVKRNPAFYRFVKSGVNLMVEYDRGKNWYVLAVVTEGELDLPKWCSPWRSGQLSSRWHRRGECSEMWDEELRARIFPIRAHAADFEWDVIECDPEWPDFTELNQVQYEELAAGDTVGDDAKGKAMLLAEQALIKARKQKEEEEEEKHVNYVYRRSKRQSPRNSKG